VRFKHEERPTRGRTSPRSEQSEKHQASVTKGAVDFGGAGEKEDAGAEKGERRDGVQPLKEGAPSHRETGRTKRT